MKTLGEFVRETRDKRDISLREFARKIECSPAFLSDIELGKRNPSEDVFNKIALCLNVSIKELKVYDTRPPIEDIRKLSISDPKMAFAFRTLQTNILKNKISSDDLLKFAEQLTKKKK